MENYVLITDVYENALKQMHTLSPIEQTIIAGNIAELQYIDELIAKKNSKRPFEAVVNEIASQIYRKTAIVDIMQMSALVYKGREAGYDVSRLVSAMHKNGEWLLSEQSKNMKKL